MASLVRLGKKSRDAGSCYEGSAWRSPCLAGAAGFVRRVVQAFVQGDGSVDQRQVGECLREVADLFAGGGDLFGVQADVVRVGQHLLEGQARVVEPARPRKGVDIQECAERERSF